MDEKQAETGVRTGDAAPAGTPAAAAAAYLDLWERHVAQAAVQGPVPPRPRPG